jgi:hypothetical protein
MIRERTQDDPTENLKRTLLIAFTSSNWGEMSPWSGQ